jgi:hypothetical protein
LVIDELSPLTPLFNVLTQTTPAPSTSFLVSTSQHFGWLNLVGGGTKEGRQPRPPVPTCHRPLSPPATCPSVSVYRLGIGKGIHTFSTNLHHPQRGKERRNGGSVTHPHRHASSSLHSSTHHSGGLVLPHIPVSALCISVVSSLKAERTQGARTSGCSSAASPR